MPHKDTTPPPDFSSVFSRLIYRVVTVLSVVAALMITAMLLRQETLHPYMESHPWMRGAVMLAAAFLTAVLCVKLFFRKTPTHGTECVYPSGYGEQRGQAGKLIWSLTGVAALAAVLALFGWAFNGCHNEMNARGLTHGGLVARNEELRILREEVARAVQAAQPPPPKTWHGLTGGIEKTLTLSGEWSEKILVLPTHKVRWDDSPRNIRIRINGTNVLPVWGGFRTNRMDFVEFKTADGAVATLTVATGILANGR